MPMHTNSAMLCNFYELPKNSQTPPIVTFDGDARMPAQQINDSAEWNQNNALSSRVVDFYGSVCVSAANKSAKLHTYSLMWLMCAIRSELSIIGVFSATENLLEQKKILIY